MSVFVYLFVCVKSCACGLCSSRLLDKQCLFMSLPLFPCVDKHVYLFPVSAVLNMRRNMFVVACCFRLLVRAANSFCDRGIFLSVSISSNKAFESNLPLVFQGGVITQIRA